MIQEKPLALVVTENLNTKLFFRKNLEDQFHVIEKKEDAAAIETAETLNLDLVIIDEKIENAIDLCFQLKKRKRLFTTPIILITKSIKKAYRQKAIKAGVFDFLFLPLDADQLNLLLEKCEEDKKRRKKVSSISFKLKKNNP
ncbi:MAG: hypothetical protein KR126chlam5_01526 [Candidatus Anoxychlamydiales bacterium]|nr:hypothetical protein [Candidatus Anoxychlamydiales bacterium]